MKIYNVIYTYLENGKRVNHSMLVEADSHVSAITKAKWELFKLKVKPPNFFSAEPV
jgi:hypothetical protein